MFSDDIAIRVQNLSKCYHLYAQAQDRLKQAIVTNLRRILGLCAKDYFREFWALHDASFEIKKGETVGIIGRNGSGKSTLLQLICGTLTPTSGVVETKGRIAGLLELGTGFNPEFTGVENVYLNGAILGMSKEEIDVRFEDIAMFADIGEFINQPVKTYSSGMLVRLAFAVQVQVQPDILVVDEALAVGDSLFQKRCYQQIEKLVANGTTLLFVSHDQEVVRGLTHRAILLDHGKILSIGTSSDIFLEYRRLLHDDEKNYLQRYSAQRSAHVASRQIVSLDKGNMSEDLAFGDRDAEIVDVTVFNQFGEKAGAFDSGEMLKIRVSGVAHKSLCHLNVSVRIRNKEGIKVYSWGTLNQDIAIWAGLKSGEVFWDLHFHVGQVFMVEFQCQCTLGQNFYEIQAAISQEEDRFYQAQRMLHWRDEAAFFHVLVKPREYFFGGVSDLQMKAEFKLA